MTRKGLIPVEAIITRSKNTASRKGLYNSRVLVNEKKSVLYELVVKKRSLTYN
jgi:hypothetical protein